MSNNTHGIRTVGQSYHQFKYTKSIAIPELQCFLHELVHEPSGALVMHIENNDPENLFCLSFQTLPDNSNGVAHILEHTVLCGSKKFPVKDPFFAMNRRSLNTFMNALTGADFTCYPAATQVHKDFYNLLEVYLDAVFHPLLSEFSFLQEGHRLEFSDPLNPQSPLEIKGIVYNEMKGAMASPSARLSEAINETLFPNITYGQNAGGDPKEIPKLTYQELKAFHQTYYHPSRCLFFFYGSLNLERHLDFIANHTLNHTQKLPPLPPINKQPRFSSPVYKELTYPISSEDDPKDKTMIAFAWLTCSILDQQDALALSILEIILMDTDASPLKMALLKSGLCKQVSSFIDVELNEIPWGVTLKGCDKENADALEKIVKDTLKSIMRSGIPLQMIDNAIHQLEFYRSEITGDHAPFGLSLFMRSALLKQHGADPAQGLMIHSLFEKMHQNTLSNPLYFSNLIKKYLIENPHFIRIVMLPDIAQGEREASEEKNFLTSIKNSLSSEEIQAIVDQTSELAQFQKLQEEEDGIDSLPKVYLSDIPLSSKDYPLSKEKAGRLTVFHQNVFTNEIVYADLIFKLSALEEKDLAYLRLFTVLLGQTGCANRSYEETLEYIQGNTGGVGASINLNLKAHNYLDFTPTFHIRGKSLHRKAPKLLTLLHEMASDTKLNDFKRLKEIIIKHFAGIESRLSQNALKYAINLSASSLNQASKMANDLYGLDYFWKLRDIVKDFDTFEEDIFVKLQDIQSRTTCVKDPHLVLGCDGEMYNQLKNHKFYGLQDIKQADFTPWIGNFPLHPIQPQGRVIASPVAFIGKVFPTVSYTHPDSPALNIAAFLFDNLTLHAKIREQGGAYGGGAVCNALSGNFYFYSYRDPNILSTLNAFDESIQNVIEGNFDDTDLEEAKFEMMQGLDAPLSPGSQSDTAYGWLCEGRTLEIRQAYRNRLLALTHEDIVDAVERIIAKNVNLGSPVIFAGREMLEKANLQLLSEGKLPLLIESV